MRSGEERFGPQAGRKRGRQFIDCREYPSEMNWPLALSADNEDELLEAAVQHAITVHGHEDTPDLRTMIRTAMRDGTPPVEAPRRAAWRRPAGCLLKAPERRFLLVRWRHFGRISFPGTPSFPSFRGR